MLVEIHYILVLIIAIIILVGIYYYIKPLTKEGLDTIDKDMPLREFTIKSSYNSAIKDNVASADNIRAVLEKGCRLVDFEIYTRDGIEYVSYSGDPEFKNMDTDGNRLSLGEAFSTVAGNAFTNPSPSPEDPLFILLRIKNNSADAHSRIAKMLDASFKTRLYNAEVNRGTKINKLMGKVVIIIDVQSSPQYKTGVKCSAATCHQLEDYVNIEAGSVQLPKYTYSDLTTLPAKPVSPDSDFMRTDIKSFMIITPTQVEQIKPLEPDVVLNTWHPQFLLVKYGKDTEAYDAIFNDYGASIVPMAHIVKNSYKKNSAAPE